MEKKHSSNIAHCTVITDRHAYYEETTVTRANP